MPMFEQEKHMNQNNDININNLCSYTNMLT